MTTTDAQPRPELGFYALAGQPDSSRDLIEEVRDAEAMGLGTAFISLSSTRTAPADRSGRPVPAHAR